MTEQDFIIQLHNKLSAIADLALYYYNPCNIEGTSCRAGDPNPCCVHTVYGKGVCPFLKNGCVAENLDCKVWFCQTALDAMDEKGKRLFSLLEDIGKEYALVHKPFLGDSYVGADKR